MKSKKPIQHSNSTKLVRRTLLVVKRETGQWSIRETARRLKINPKYVFDNLIHGIEPTDRTQKGQEVRQKLGLPRLKKKEKSNTIKPKKRKEEFIIKWEHLPKDERRKVIKEYLKWKESNENKMP